jgi:hypothetical protein
LPSWLLGGRPSCQTLGRPMKYEILADEIVIGWSELEKGDPPMGVALGVFHPTEAYGRLTSGAVLRVRPEDAAFFEPVAGVHIEDFSGDLGPDGMEVSVLGIDADTYQRYFPMHLKAYDDQFAK